MTESDRILPFPGRRAPGEPSGAPAIPTLPEPAPTLEGVVLLRGGRRLLDGLTLRLPGHGITALMGPNGAGKSLSLRVMAGLVRPDLGQVRSIAIATSLVFQRPVLLRRSVRANLDHALRAARVPRRERPGRVAELLGLGALEGLADQPARALSGGEAQRLALVRALAVRPRLLLLDEPTASLDPRSTAAIERLAARVAEEATEVVLVTHDPGQAARMADRIIFMHRGRDVETAPAAAFLDRPETPAARAYLDGRLLI
ncbi:MAG: ABC transporter ATP-binding protein [Rhodobacteraceae bacterium]|nr:ABC transporter ATP-binding protein [Paracoccaceae bacterium]